MKNIRNEVIAGLIVFVIVGIVGLIVSKITGCSLNSLEAFLKCAKEKQITFSLWQFIISGFIFLIFLLFFIFIFPKFKRKANKHKIL